MTKEKNILISILINALLLLTWFVKMILSSDIPVKISFSGFIILSILLILSLILYSIYVRKTKYILGNIICMLILLFLWFMSMERALRFHYQNLDTMISVLGFSVVLICFIELLYNKYKNRLPM